MATFKDANALSVLNLLVFPENKGGTWLRLGTSGDSGGGPSDVRIHFNQFTYVLYLI